MINYIREEYENQFEMVALFQDWHCPNDVSFASQYSGMTPKQKLVLTYSKKGNTLVCLVRLINLKFAKRLDSRTAEAPVKFQSDTIMLMPSLATLRLHEIFR